MKYLIYFFLIIVFFTNCKKKEAKDYSYLLALINNNNNGKSYALFKFVSGLSGSSNTYSNFFYPTAENQSSKPKIILVHGWDYNDRTTNPIKTDSQKVDSILSTWDRFLTLYANNVSNSKDNYDIYTFTYLSSDSVYSNSTRLIELIKANFTVDDKVIIVAHSMGGLVSRSALYHSDNSTNYIDMLITLATPFYGSPLASSQFNVSSTFINALKSYTTGTEGGGNLAHTNSGSGQLTISGATNTYLDTLNSNTNRDNLIYPLVGILSDNGITANCTSTSSTLYQTSCGLLKDTSPNFTLNDGVVPENSAKMTNKSTNYNSANDLLLGYDHTMMSLMIDNDINNGKSTVLYTKIFTKIQSL